MEVLNYENHNISFDLSNTDVMVNATQMAKPFGKLVGSFLRLKEIKQYISLIELRYADSHNGNDYKALKVIQGGNPKLQGTWMCKKLALRFAQWLSPEFALWVDDKIEELLQTGSTSIKPLSPAKMILQQAQLLVDIEEKQKEQAERILKLESKVNTSPDYFTVIGFATLHNVQIGRTKAASLGRRCSNICKTKEYDIGKVNDVRYGMVNSYPSIVLEQVFNDQNLIRKKQS